MYPGVFKTKNKINNYVNIISRTNYTGSLIFKDTKLCSHPHYQGLRDSGYRGFGVLIQSEIY